MTPEEMASDEMKKVREKFIKESINDAQLVREKNYFISIESMIKYLIEITAKLGDGSGHEDRDAEMWQMQKEGLHLQPIANAIC
jgi:hypothetical protein